MADVLVCGAGPTGLAAAMMLARDGHRVTVLEKDPAEPPTTNDEAWDRWERKGVNQFRLPHYLHALFRQVMRQELPGVLDALEDAGSQRFNPLAMMPPSITDRDPRPGDDRWEAVTGRRPTVERVMARLASEEPGVDVRRGISVAGFVTGPSVTDPVPHVVGVRTADGQEIRADLVVDALGRRSAFPDWIAEVGGRRPYEEAEDCGFTYYGRYFRSDDGSLPEVMAGLLTPAGTISVLTLPSDDGTWSVTLYAESKDRPLKELRKLDVWTKVVQALPLHAQWLEGEPISDIMPMSGIPDRYRRFVVDGSPVATGALAVGDAWASTNPSLGRGMSLGVKHAALLRDVVRKHADQPAEMARVWDEVTEAEVAPWYWTQVEMDRARHAEIDALRDGREPPKPTDDQGKIAEAFVTAAFNDADLFRSFLDVMSCLAPPMEVMSRPGVFERVLEVAEGAERIAPPAPSREELLSLVS